MSVASQLGYIAASILFILGLRMLGRADTARRGNLVSASGMLLAVLVTLAQGGLDYTWIVVGLVVGTAIGVVAAQRVQMTQMPEMVALFNGSGGLASLLVGWAEYHNAPEATGLVAAMAIFAAVLVGAVTFTGSVVAWGKLSERIPGRPILFSGQQLVNGVIIALALILGILFVAMPASGYPYLLLLVLVALIFGVLFVLPIGGADMPIVVSLLNSYSGIAASAAGFIIGNTVLIVAGSLVGASGLILTQIMCKAMNRSLANVLFSGFGSAAAATGGRTVEGEVQALTAEDAYYILEAARNVLIVPGYGMAVAQAQHAVRELSELLEANGGSATSPPSARATAA